jgi:polynucleotide 5'-hydroxyl-kinase GRC3/NOL9
VDGPASVTLISGNAEVFGFQIADSHRIIIREGKRLPFKILENATFDVALGKDAAIAEVEGSTIPCTWQTAVTAILEIRTTPAVVMVVGGADSGKSSFCTYLANRLVNGHCRVAVLDEDLGQSDIGPPCTVAYAIVAKPVTDLFSLKPENVFFVGATSPSEAPDKTVEAAAAMTKKVRAKADFIIVNTDGWTLGEDAIAFKQHLAEALKPDMIFSLQHRGEPSSLSGAFGSFKVESLDAPFVVRERNSEKRRTLRELGFIKYLENARVKVFPLSHITVEGVRKDAPFQLRDVENLLIGLHDTQRHFLGIGIIQDVDFSRKALRVYTAVDEKPAIVVLGMVRIDENLHEIPKTN